MTGGVHAVDSVMSFTPCDGWQLVYVGDGSLAVEDRPQIVVDVVGWAQVCVQRSQFVTTACIRPMAVMGGALEVVAMGEDWELTRKATG